MDTNRTDFVWTSRRALMLMTLCLFVGIAGGYAIRGNGVSAADAPAKAAPPAPVAMNTGTATETPAPNRLKEMADQQAAPLLARLKADPANPDLLNSVGNLYYDAQVYPIAVGYYGQSLAAKPADAAVRTDMATAYWYMGDPDRAISEFDRALGYAPNNPNTLFNRGMVKWQGKRDAAGAIADWKKLLATNPKYEERNKVEQMLADVEKQVGLTAGN